MLWLLLAAAIASSAALLFAVQPMAARMLLPVAGGTASVWTVSVLFFQSALLAGYAYAHLRLPVRRQMALHVVLLAGAVATLPLVLPEWSPPAQGVTAPWVAAMLLVGLGLPFLALAATSPLLQRWLAASDHPRAGDPYVLYRASNAGSLLGLLAYPVLIEPRLGLSEQTHYWSVGFSGCAVLLIACAALLGLRVRPSARGIAPFDGGKTAAAPPSRTRLLGWVALAAVPSSLMLAVTAKLSTDVAPMPLIWVVPLALYLVSFMLVFSPGRAGPAAAKTAAACLPICALTAVWLLATERSTPVAFVFAAYLLLVLCAATACHGRLAATRPAPQHLTLFYLAVGAGGAAGGLFNALLAPVIFDGLAELPLAIVGALLCLPARATRHRLAIGATRVLVLASALALVAGDWPLPALTGDELLFAGLACGCVLLSRWPRALALAAAAVLLGGWLPAAFDESVLLRERSFFGTIQVRAFGENGRGRELLHGTTRHGAQFDVGARPPEPISYYHRSGPAAMAARVLRRRGALPSAAVVGLGAGAMACHGSRGERWIFFEVDPEIARIAADPELFSFVRDCPPELRIRIVDGRLGLAETASGSLGLIVLDAFSSDAVPLHLLTRDAVAMYRSRLLPGGILAFHISNRYLDLETPLGNIARELGLACAYALDAPVDRRGQFVAGKQYSEWVFMADDKRALGRLADWPRCTTDSSQRTWSDEFGDIWSALEWGALD